MAVSGSETLENQLTSLLGEPAPLLPMAAEGRVFEGSRKIRLGDVDPSGRLRFDGLTRYTQDVSDDDTIDAGMPDKPGWVVRSTVVDELVPGSLGETLTFKTFCSSLGKRWAERRLTVTGSGGAHYEVATLWVCIDFEAGQPTMLTDEFLSIYGEAAAGRKASARLVNPKLADLGEAAAGAQTDLWHLRRVDYDTLGHVNNAAYWAAVEQWLPPYSGPRRARVEYGKGLSPLPQVGMVRLDAGACLLLWWLEDQGGPPKATACIAPLPANLY
jgi:acyl-ACP thioesterase